MVVENVDLYSALDWFEGVGGFDIILPFLLIFAITFAILQKIGLFGDATDAKTKRINLIVSLIIGFFLIMQQGLVALIQGFLPRVSMIVLVVLMFFLVLGIFTGGAVFGQKLVAVAGVLSVVAILWALGASFGWNVPLWDWFTEQDIAVLLVIGAFVLVVWLIVKEPKQNRKGISKSLGSLLEGLGKELGGGTTPPKKG